MTTELRREPIVDRWVLVRTTKAWGPADYEKEDNAPRHFATSPFIYGREHFTPPEVDSIRPDGSAPNTPGWQCRVVPNKFPALRIEGELEKHGEGIFDVSNGIGAHEVLIETPDPKKQLADLPVEEIEGILRLYINRRNSLAKDPRFKYIMIFKNYGESAGTSIEHAHSQIIALPMIPINVREELEGAKEYYQYRGRNIFVDLMQQEYQDKDRIVTENDDFVCFCPFVPRYSFESWILPKKEDSRFNKLSDGERRNLASILKDILTRIKTCLSDPSYNFYLHIAPVDYEHEESFLWHIEIVPKLTHVAGFEWNTGFYVVNTPPEKAAELLRKAK